MVAGSQHWHPCCVLDWSAEVGGCGGMYSSPLPRLPLRGPPLLITSPFFLPCPTPGGERALAFPLLPLSVTHPMSSSAAYRYPYPFFPPPPPPPLLFHPAHHVFVTLPPPLTHTCASCCMGAV